MPPTFAEESVFPRLEERTRRFQPPQELAAPLEQVRDYLRQELGEEIGPMPLVRAGLVLAVAAPEVPAQQLVPLAAGVEMVYHAVLAQLATVREKSTANLLALLSNDLILARALRLYASERDARLMETVSAGAVFLCESLTADHFDPLSPPVIDRLAHFYGACVEIGAVLAKSPESVARPWIEMTRRKLAAALVNVTERADSSKAKEKPEPLEKIEPNEPPLLEAFLKGWLEENSEHSDALMARR